MHVLHVVVKIVPPFFWEMQVQKLFYTTKSLGVWSWRAVHDAQPLRRLMNTRALRRSWFGRCHSNGGGGGWCFVFF